jgi:holo-[acyl-carrier protein] synthase
MVECGVDLIEISRIEKAVTRLGDRFVNRVFTPGERAYAAGRLPQLAARWAAKEAAAKILGTGVWRDGVTWHDFEVVNAPGGKPGLRLNGQAAVRAAELGLTHWSVSLSHSRGDAIAFVVASRAV